MHGKGAISVNKNFGLSHAEKEIMELLWQSREPLSFREILDYANDTWKKNWKKQTLNTYLLNMQKAGLIGSERRGKKETFGGAVYSLAAVFTGGERLSEEKAEKLRKLI